mmetsp:Transcript_51983/g.113183  ORF Transcript_51983/g.113183 Transcript_51983/m.113183 type:complete len:213 (-) Transcript_51983:124-762(-)
MIVFPGDGHAHELRHGARERRSALCLLDECAQPVGQLALAPGLAPVRARKDVGDIRAEAAERRLHHAELLLLGGEQRAPKSEHLVGRRRARILLALAHLGHLEPKRREQTLRQQLLRNLIGRLAGAPAQIDLLAQLMQKPVLVAHLLLLNGLGGGRGGHLAHGHFIRVEHRLLLCGCFENLLFRRWRAQTLPQREQVELVEEQHAERKDERQ